MLKKVLLAASVLGCSFAASAGWQLGGGYSNISSDEGGIDVSLGALYASAGYKYDTSHKGLSIVPELRLGVGIGDDDVRIFGRTVNVEVDRFVAFSVRAQQTFDNDVYAYVMPTYADLKIEASAFGNSASDSDSEFGYGLGLGYNVSSTSSIELSYEDIDDADIISIGYKVNF